MNRIILIGNGFDLAHGLPTSYRNFIDDFWKKTIKEVQNSHSSYKFTNNEIEVQPVPELWVAGDTYENFRKSIDNARSILTFKNYFLEVISNKAYLQNWVDIENEYYSLLKKISQTQYTIFV